MRGRRYIATRQPIRHPINVVIHHIQVDRLQGVDGAGLAGEVYTRKPAPVNSRVAKVKEGCLEIADDISVYTATRLAGVITQVLVVEGLPCLFKDSPV